MPPVAETSAPYFWRKSTARLVLSASFWELTSSRPSTRAALRPKAAACWRSHDRAPSAGEPGAAPSEPSAGSSEEGVPSAFQRTVTSPSAPTAVFCATVGAAVPRVSMSASPWTGSPRVRTRSATLGAVVGRASAGSWLRAGTGVMVNSPAAAAARRR
ncbi:hypothetical protein [Nocardioides sp. B-3]|uniref:hypothetical protein n=1 Tax=Nocardioides sp. B-3 TaxID=2895565 RepID=UPI002152F69A|nr:hypothetical protein [Nocardioides sp. B-3]UUZ58424.1 hypothetical protein LP418_19860 [Nocardioides sp. B-3]